MGSLLWLSTATRPDIVVITSILAKYQNHSSPGHLSAAKYVLKYLKGTKTLGIAFHSDDQFNIQSFINFPIPNLNFFATCDANWGPQDQSIPNPQEPSPPSPKTLISSNHAPFQDTSSISMALYIGKPNARELQLVARQKPKYMLQTSVSKASSAFPT